MLFYTCVLHCVVLSNGVLSKGNVSCIHPICRGRCESAVLGPRSYVLYKNINPQLPTSTKVNVVIPESQYTYPVPRTPDRLFSLLFPFSRFLSRSLLSYAHHPLAHMLTTHAAFVIASTAGLPFLSFPLSQFHFIRLSASFSSLYLLCSVFLSASRSTLSTTSLPAALCLKYHLDQLIISLFLFPKASPNPPVLPSPSSLLRTYYL